jgi:hypothetical protein
MPTLAPVSLMLLGECFASSFMFQLHLFRHSYHGFLKEASFSVGLQGISEADTDKVLSIIDDTFDKVIK